MTDAIISSVMSVILGNLNSLTLEELGLAGGLKTELENVQSTLTTIQALLQDAEKKQWKSDTVKNWLRKLKDAALDADDALDEFATEALRRRLDSQRGVRSRVSTFFSLRNPLVFRLKMAHRLKNIRERLDAISAEKLKFHLKEGDADIEVNGVEGRQTSSLVIEPEIVGRHDEKEKIIGVSLTDLSDQEDVAIYVIWGMGGVGKTTLAQLVYNDTRVERHFEMRLWVCVSDDFEIRRLTRAIIESIDIGSSCNISELDPLQQRLREKLGGRRFLLVLDDVWNENHEKWDRLKAALRCGAKGSMVIVTTRIEKIALLMATVLPIHHIGSLSEEDSWSLFKRRAFGMGRKEGNSDLESIGKEIVNKCGGVPLAIKALGSLMCLKSRTSEWLSVKESEIWNLSDDETAILPALRLSYDHLPPYLKQCFAYCCLFPKDHAIKKDMLIRLWMANGFIPSRGQTELHDIGLQIFNELVWRSFFQDVKANSFDNNITCKMHDLMHDLAQSIMRFECSTMESSKLTEIQKGVRHLSWSSLKSKPWNDDTIKTRSLRSFIQFYQDCSSTHTFSFLSQQKYLRVLDLRYLRLRKLSISIGSLKHLRYLDLTRSHIEVLPESTCCLPNLQTLILRACCRLSKLPEGMKHLRNLTYLDLTFCISLTCTPPKMGQLTRLRLLSLFIVGKGSGYDIDELKELNLGGELSIKRLGNVQNSTDAKKANLMGKKNLQSLSLSWEEEDDESVLVENAEDVLGALQPHSDLKKLHIRNYQGSKFPNWMMDLNLQNVVEMSLENCRRCEQLPALGKLPFLEVLDIHGMDAVKCFGNECYGDRVNSFPALERLKLSGMRNLEEWRTLDESESFPCLRELGIHDCPKLVDLPILLSLETLFIARSNVMLLRSVMNFTSLTSLNILGFNDLTVLPDELKNLNSLESLHISDNNSLVSFPANGLRGLSSLRSLLIHDCKKFVSFSNGLRYLTALERFTIISCPEVNALPQGLENLTALKWLQISRCPHLEKRCKNESGEDWPKIAHILTIKID